MTKLSKFGTKDGKQIEAEIVQNPTDDFKVKADNEWIGKDIRAKSTPLIDPGTGKPVIIRMFEFGMNPEFKGQPPTKQDIFNMHWRQIAVMLWGDGLTPRQDINPRVEFMKGRKYRIFITCEPRLSTFVAEKPQTLNQILKKST